MAFDSGRHAGPAQPSGRGHDGSRPQRQRPVRGHEGRQILVRRLQQGRHGPQPERFRQIRLVRPAGQGRDPGHRHGHGERAEPCRQGRAEGHRSGRRGEHRRGDQRFQLPVRQNRRRGGGHGHRRERLVRQGGAGRAAACVDLAVRFRPARSVSERSGVERAGVRREPARCRHEWRGLAELPHGIEQHHLPSRQLVDRAYPQREHLHRHAFRQRRSAGVPRVAQRTLEGAHAARSGIGRRSNRFPCGRSERWRRSLHRPACGRRLQRRRPICRKTRVHIAVAR